MKIISVVGARPNFMKIAPFVRAVERHNASAAADGGPRLEHRLVHTGQHYDERMSRAFFDALDIPRPDTDLDIGSGSHAEQVGQTMMAFEKVIRQSPPDWVVVVGDVNATCACSITAKKEGVRVAHIEAGLRSRDMTMPEEINRLVTDRLADLLFTPDELSGANLRAEGVPEERIRFVGNIMIDTLEIHRAQAEALSVDSIIANNRLEGGTEQRAPVRLDPSQPFALLTLHRPSNVDRRETLEPLVRLFVDEIASRTPLVWTIHPRARKQLEEFGLWDDLLSCPRIVLLEPLGYPETLKLNMEAAVVLTDSGGMQEECCVLGTPCLTLRWNTERPITLREHGGVSVLVGNDPGHIRSAFNEAMAWGRQPVRPPLWDGRTADRIAEALAREK
ncbi:MAG TPA: UDP-N-acetylglucosamine 2-epimerase (non-hydrolyzing) [Kiritimatiellia bacterium]|nr:UDP-N-acetylglucosamine 2-epimerase (non-hydrolyzing) [Kiritimatiellia bacterium]